MNKFRLFLAVGILAAIIIVLISAVPSGAKTVPPNSCTYTGDTNVYGVYDQPLEVNLGTVHDTVYEEYYCVLNGMRVYKSLADNPTEVSVLREVARFHGDKDWPTIFCRTPKGARMITVAQIWGAGGVETVNVREIDGWKKFAQSYKKNQSKNGTVCRTFS